MPKRPAELDDWDRKPIIRVNLTDEQIKALPPNTPLVLAIEPMPPCLHRWALVGFGATGREEVCFTCGARRSH